MGLDCCSRIIDFGGSPKTICFFSAIQCKLKPLGPQLNFCKLTKLCYGQGDKYFFVSAQISLQDWRQHWEDLDKYEASSVRQTYHCPGEDAGETFLIWWRKCHRNAAGICGNKVPKTKSLFYCVLLLFITFTKLNIIVQTKKINVTGSGVDLGKSYIQFVRNNMDTITKRINDDLWVLNVMEKWYYDQV